MNSNSQSLAQDINQLALELGASEATVTVTQSVSSQLSQREGKIEQCQQSQSKGVYVELLVNDRFSAHSAAETRIEALKPFLKKAIEATRYLEKDADRKLPEKHLMGSNNSQSLDVLDHSIEERTPSERTQMLNTLEKGCLHSAKGAPLTSLTAHVWDSRSDSCTAYSNGHSAKWTRSSAGMGAEITLHEDSGRLPEAYDYYSARHQSDLPTINELANSLITRGKRRLNTSAIPSERLPMLLENRCVGRILNVLISPLAGNAIYEERSCMADKLEKQIAATGLNIIDSPLIPRALSSRPYDGDGLPTQERMIIQDGILKSFFLNVYNARRLKSQTTTGSASNLRIPPSDSTPLNLLSDLPRAIRVEGFLGGNSNAMTGDFSFGITGTLFEHGQPVQGVSEMNVSGNIFELCSQFQQAANDVWTYSSWLSPSLLFDNVQFSGQ